jgi:predicted ATPase
VDMAIKSIQVSNFKSFKELEPLELGKFNVLIGANASGKSNFIEIFRFLTNMLNKGLDSAISLEGGVEYLRNMKVGPSKDFSFEIVYDHHAEGDFLNFGIRVYEEIYKFAIKFTGESGESGYEISEDKLVLKCEFFRPPLHGEKKTIDNGDIILSVVNRKIQVDLSSLPEGIPLNESNIIPPFLKGKLERELFLLQIPFGFLPPLRLLFGNIPIYDFDPKLSKLAAQITGPAELEENGRNLPLILKNIKKNNEKSKALHYHIQDILPYIEDIDVKVENKSLFFKVHETYFEEDLPAFLISDGTINLIAVIVALFFEIKPTPVIIFEEPERDIHPYLIYELMNLMKDASQHKQIIITTHNPEIVKHVNLEDLLLVSRDDEGYSTITKPSDKKEVVTAVKEMGVDIDELYVQKLLEL